MSQPPAKNALAQGDVRAKHPHSCVTQDGIVREAVRFGLRFAR